MRSATLTLARELVSSPVLSPIGCEPGVGRRIRPLRRLLLATVLLMAAGGCGSKEQYPNSPILLVCPWAAGGGTDRIARQIAALLERDLGVPINVVNVTGGDGVTGHSRGALSRPDGYTLTLVTVEIGSLHWRGMTNIAPDDYAPVGLVNEDPAAIFVRADAPWQTLADLEKAIREKPATLRASGTASGGIWHLALAGWLSAIGLKPNDVIWVSIAGSAPSFQELLAGGVDVVTTSLPEALALTSGGRVRALGVMAGARAAQFPDVPTMKELGVSWEIGTIRGIAAPKETPADRVALLAAALKRVVEGDEYQRSMRSAGFTPAYEDPSQFAATLARADEQLGALLTSEALRGLATTRFGPLFFPGLLIAALAVVSGALMVVGPRASDREPGERTSVMPGAAWRFAEVLIWIALYVAFAETLGFIVTAGVLLLLYLLRLGTRPAVAAPLSLVLVPTVYYVFSVLLRVPLPRGILG
jgi:tripartite-type tricarboxylate transporter receptor subunit TctC